MENQRSSIMSWSFHRRSMLFWGALAVIGAVLALILHPLFLIIAAFAGGGLMLIHEQP